jgi:hypothetical protein
MALDRSNEYPGRFENPTAEYPTGAFKNRTAPSSEDGSYLEQEWLKDWEGYFDRLLTVANYTPNDTTDSALVSQYHDALKMGETVQTLTGQTFVAGGTGNAITLTASQSESVFPADYTRLDGTRVTFVATADNTGAVTIDLEGLGAKAAVDKTGAAFAGGEIVTGARYDAVYDAGNDWFAVAEWGGGSVEFASEAEVIAGVVEDKAVSPATLSSVNAILQVAYAELVTSGSSTAVFPLDDTIPQSTEGVEVLTCTITPKLASSYLLIEASWNITENTNADNAGGLAALFRDSASDAFAVGHSEATGQVNGALDARGIARGVVVRRIASASTSPTTIRLRLGVIGTGAGAVAWRWNGWNSTRYFGGVWPITLTITEISA